MSGADATRIDLPGTAGMDAAIRLADQLKALGAQPVVLGASAVESMSTPFVLTLVSAIRSRGDDADRIQVENPSPPFLDAFSDLGLFGDLMKMEFLT
jgi:hypothetical protein